MTEVRAAPETSDCRVSSISVGERRDDRFERVRDRALDRRVLGEEPREPEGEQHDRDRREERARRRGRWRAGRRSRARRRRGPPGCRRSRGRSRIALDRRSRVHGAGGQLVRSLKRPGCRASARTRRGAAISARTSPRRTIPAPAELDALEAAGASPAADRGRREVDVRRAEQLGGLGEGDPVGGGGHPSVGRRLGGGRRAGIARPARRPWRPRRTRTTSLRPSLVARRRVAPGELVARRAIARRALDWTSRSRRRLRRRRPPLLLRPARCP